MGQQTSGDGCGGVCLFVCLVFSVGATSEDVQFNLSSHHFLPIGGNIAPVLQASSDHHLLHKDLQVLMLSLSKHA